ncbi:tyrosyl-tRNA synthetase [Verticillium alfalfae VaMs.102]|uniref:Tyrosine--tRNA ligase n=1 Tax=Verticillium alfalfae (strain VaMs.102 / ATCC MYA-4576 / FGSC 10136) TaxID=526221 RepID=C9SGV3_VERA1|nr:tyrosyl-tRNA synthetase [Verticillium alfalfae VaMs.102]EEY17575.1 tyrosyl-tRNA synthetase [Verticillium alfalfae VaMs.102]
MAQALTARCHHRIWRRCTNTRLAPQSLSPSRHIHLKTLQKREDAAQEWAKKAEAIKNGEARNLWEIFEERGFIKDVAGRPELIKELMRTKRIGAYVGVDPTAPSLHLGHLLPMMPVFWMYLHGFRAVTLVGGATARIGDPTGRTTSRAIMSNSEISTNITRIHYQMKKLWDNIELEKHKYGYKKTWSMSRHLVNNNTWWQSLSMYDVMKRLGRYLRMGPMLSRDTVKTKMESGDGMAVAEFMYPLMQAPRRGRGGASSCSLPQVGKSAGNAVWLETNHDERLQPVQLPRAAVPTTRSSSSSKVSFTFLAHSPRITPDSMEQQRASTPPQARPAPAPNSPLKVPHASCTAPRGPFREQQQAPPSCTARAGDGSPPSTGAAGRAPPMRPARPKILFAAGLADSASDAHRLCRQQGAYVAAAPGKDMRSLTPGNLDWTPVKLWRPEEVSRFLVDDRVLILRKGKHNVRIIEVVSDDDWKASGQTYPGEPGTGKTRMAIAALRELAEAEGKKLSQKELFALAQEKLAAEEEETVVANNPDIRFPSKLERQKVHGDLKAKDGGRRV